MSDKTPYTASVDHDDGQIRVTSGWAARIDRDTFSTLTAAGLRWKRAEEALMAPWTPAREDAVLAALGIAELDVDGTDLRDVAAGRAEHYQRYADNAAASRDQAHAAASAAVEGIPFGQPILVGHHSERRHRRAIDRAHRNMEKAVAEGERAEKWGSRTASTVAAAERRYEDPAAIERRLATIEADHRKALRGMQSADENTRRWWTRFEVFYRRRAEVARAQLAAAGGSKTTGEARPAVEKGGAVKWRGEWYRIARVNGKTVTVSGWLGIETMTYRLPLNEISETMSAERMTAAEQRRAAAAATA